MDCTGEADCVPSIPLLCQLQAFEAAHFIRMTRRAPLCLFMADMNANPYSLVYRLLTQYGGLQDSFITNFSAKGMSGVLAVLLALRLMRECRRLSAAL